MNFESKIISFGKKAWRMRILRKRFLGQQRVASELLKNNPQPELTKEEKQGIDEYWMPYGIRFRNYSWHQFLYGVTGIRDPRFLPKEFALYLLVPYYNNQKLTDAYKDKNYFDRYLPTANFPKTVFKRINGDFFDNDNTFITSHNNDILRSLLLSQSQVIVKNAFDSGRGLNVRKYSIHSASEADAVINEWAKKKNYIVQELIKQHSFFSQFNKSSVNIIRINSWYQDGQVFISTPVIRYGTPGYATDVCYINGEEIIHMIGVTLDGYIRDRIYEMDGTWTPLEKYISQPILKVPSWEKIILMVKREAAKLPHFRMIGWDITVDELEEPIVIEYNIYQPGPYPSQLTGGPMWGEMTDKVFDFLKDKDKQHQLIPRNFRV